MDLKMIGQHALHFMDLMTRGVVALETIAKNTTPVELTACVGTTVVSELKGDVAATAKVTPADTPLAEANQAARDAAAKATSPNGSAQKGDATSTGASATSGEKAKKVSVDDVRAALKAYAAKEGNPAAMALLGEFGAKSVSELASGDEAEAQSKMAKFVAKCSA